MPLVALCSLSEFATHIAYALSATTPRRARSSSPGPRKCPAITQFGSTDTFGLELSQLGPDASPPANILSSSAKAIVFRKGKTSVLVGETHSQHSELVQRDKITLLSTEAMAPCGSALARLRDFLFQLFKTNDCCWNKEKGYESNSDRDPRVNTSEKNSTRHGDSTPGLWHNTMANHATPDICKLLRADAYLREEKHRKSSFGAKSDTFWQDTSNIKHSFDTRSIKHPFDATRNHGLNFTTANLLQPNFTIAKHSLPRNKNQYLKLLFLALERQQPGRRVYSSTLNSHNDIFERINNQFDQSIAPDVTSYFTKTSLSLFGLQVFESVVRDLCLNKYTQTTTRIGYSNITSAANKIELAF